MPRKGKSDYATAFGQALDAQLSKKGMSQSALARTVNTSSPYVNQLMKGTRLASPQWTDIIANALDLSEAERADLHRAAAISAGYKLDLTK